MVDKVKYDIYFVKNVDIIQIIGNMFNENIINKIMTEDIIKYDTAKKAKEKRFNWECYEYFTTDGEIERSVNFTCSNEEIDCFFNKGMDSVCLAPTQSLLQKWFRDTHGIFISIYNDITNDWVYEIRSGYPESVYKGNSIMSKCTYTKYEMALEDALLYSLELLK